MNTGQSILTLLAMLLLSTLVLRVNSTLLNSGNTVTNAKLGLTAISLAQSRLEEIKSKAFDNKTVGTVVSSTSSLTSSSTKEPDNGTYPNFNDVEDYNGFSYKDTVIINPHLSRDSTNWIIFNELDSVVYVSSSSPDQISSSQTWNKKIIVKIWQKQMTDTIKVSTIFSYFVFR
jgi:hypothetical protein